MDCPVPRYFKVEHEPERRISYFEVGEEGRTLRQVDLMPGGSCRRYPDVDTGDEGELIQDAAERLEAQGDPVAPEEFEQFWIAREHR